MRIDICLISDEKYAIYLGTVIVSILKNSNDNDELFFHIINTGMSKNSIDKLIELKTIKDFKIQFYNYDHTKYVDLYNQKLKVQCHISASALVKLEIHNILKDLDKVLYLDCDVIVNKDLHDFFIMDIDNYYLAVTPRPIKFTTVNEETHIKSEAKYFNSGVMLLNLKKFRDVNIDSKFTEYLNSIEKISYILDQEVFNAVLKDNIKYIDDRYNISIDQFIIQKVKPLMLENIYIIHYSGKYKPWNLNYKQLYYSEEYWKYFYLTPWFKEEPVKHIITIIDQRINRLDIDNSFKIVYDKSYILEKENKLHNDKISALEKENKLSNDKILTLEKENKLYNDKILTLEKENKLSNDKILTLEKENKLSNDKILALEKENKLYNDKILALEKENKLSNDKISALEKENKLSNDKILTLEKENKLSNEKIIKLVKEISNIHYKINKIINTIAWWIPIKKWRDNFRDKFAITRPDQTRPDQTRPDQTRPNYSICINYICFYNNSKYKKIQPMLQHKIAA
ncbi:glycosyltransferase [Brachyspira innocens]|uniref:glycosyltransferase n=1 Tax=Brachyspira innocens TaxID=13264 RepID=UPI0026EBE3B7|nr:glycosyltransferase [Brachyspira innocens]